jgi:hypothetical protein
VGLPDLRAPLGCTGSTRRACSPSWPATR